MKDWMFSDKHLYTPINEFKPVTIYEADDIYYGNGELLERFPWLRKLDISRLIINTDGMLYLVIVKIGTFEFKTSAIYREGKFFTNEENGVEITGITHVLDTSSLYRVV